MATQNCEVSYGGAVIYWNLSGDFSHDKLEAGLKSLGLGSFCPSPRSPSQAVRQALVDTIKDCKFDSVLVRSLDNPRTDGFLVVKEDRGKSDNEYTSLFYADFRQYVGVCVQTPEGGPIDPALEAAIKANYQKCSVLVSRYDVVKCLTQVLHHLGGTSLRDSGAVYWLAESQLQKWDAVCQIIQSAAKSECKIYQLRTVVDDHAVAALRDAVSHMVASEASSIAERSHREGVKQRFLIARKNEAQKLHDKVRHWESVLNLTLTDLHTVADRCEAEVVESALAAFPSLFGDADHFDSADHVDGEELATV